MPRQQTHVITAIHTTAATISANVEPAAEFQPTSRKVYFEAMIASVAMTMTSAAKIAQPDSHPRYGPSARVTHENDVPQSGSALLKYL